MSLKIFNSVLSGVTLKHFRLVPDKIHHLAVAVEIHLSGCTSRKTRHTWLRTIKSDLIPLYILPSVEDGILNTVENTAKT